MPPSTKVVFGDLLCVQLVMRATTCPYPSQAVLKACLRFGEGVKRDPFHPIRISAVTSALAMTTRFHHGLSVENNTLN